MDALHILLDGGGGLLLVGGILEEEGGFELLLEIGIGREGESARLLPLAVELYQILRYILYLGLRGVLEILPRLRSQFVDARRLSVTSKVSPSQSRASSSEAPPSIRW